jgi:Zn-dependent peptidase ImmA (M78 family)
MKVSYISYEEIERIVNETLKKYGYENYCPVPIEEILDNQLNINIVPVPDLFRTFEINAFTTYDRKEIHVDEYLYTNLERPYRFTLAHELGHIILHGCVFELAKIRSIGDWKQFINDIEESDYRRLEIQANNFAGVFLVPSKVLEENFNREITNFKDEMKKVARAGIKRSDYIQYFIDLISSILIPVFEVDQQVIRIRIERCGLEQKVSF